MTTIQISWRASKMIPCPICRANHSCSATDTGMHFCWRTHHDVPGWVHVGDTRNGFGMFVDEGHGGGRQGNAHHGPRAAWRNTTTANRPARSGVTPEELTAYLSQHLACVEDRRVMADVLGVHPVALERLQVGYVPETEDEQSHWLFPERDASGRVVGLLRRYLSGQKLQYPGSHRGISFDPAVEPAGPILIVEGPSDVAAALSMGLHAVGKPSNLGGTDFLATFLEPFVRRGTEVVVLGENDRKPDRDLWPGREGAIQTARELANRWNVPVAWSLPPDGVKDLRAWFWCHKPDIADSTRCSCIGKQILSDARNRQVVELPGGRKTNEQNAQKNAEHEDCETAENEDCEPTESITPAPPGFLGEREVISETVRQIIEDGCGRGPCPRHYTPLLQSRKNPRAGLALRADCRTFPCPACGPRRRSRWLLHPEISL